MIRRIRIACAAVMIAGTAVALGALVYYVGRQLATDVFVLVAGAR